MPIIAASMQRVVFLPRHILPSLEFDDRVEVGDTVKVGKKTVLRQSDSVHHVSDEIK